MIIVPVSTDCGANIVVDHGRIPVQAPGERRSFDANRAELPNKFNQLGKF
ncbi:hypothetical protein GWE18_29210 [Bradyrhizobium sp. CSA112]|nr:hypothetical protein [Bradyrhizobium sp. CSA112]MDE5456835.1 hypothetical protein [Bradyrhizobium sp. CSA112]